MQIVKTLSYADTNAGQVKVADVTTNCPTHLRASINMPTLFNVWLNFNVIFVPATGTTRTISKGIVSLANPSVDHIYDLRQAPQTQEPDGLYMTGNGELFISLTTTDPSNPLPTSGEVIVFITIEAFPFT